MGERPDHPLGQSVSEHGTDQNARRPRIAGGQWAATYLRERVPCWVEKYLSLRSVRWRLEACVTGKPFTEIVLARSSLYVVEQVFLIERESGLLLQHVAAPGATVADANLVAGMFSAIEGFTNESFGRSDTLETTRLGECQIWVQRGAKAELLAVVSGRAPLELQQVFKDAVVRIHIELAQELDEFSQRGAAVDAARRYLDACLLGRAPIR